MNSSALVDCQAFILLMVHFFAAYGQGLINRVKVPVQELGGQRGEGAYFCENTVHVLTYYGLSWCCHVFLPIMKFIR